MRVAAIFALLVGTSLVSACAVSVHQHTAWPAPVPPVQVSRVTVPPPPPPPARVQRVPADPNPRRAVPNPRRAAPSGRSPQGTAGRHRQRSAERQRPSSSSAEESTRARRTETPSVRRRTPRPRVVPRPPEGRRSRTHRGDEDGTPSPRGRSTDAQSPPGRPRVLRPAENQESAG